MVEIPNNISIPDAILFVVIAFAGLQIVKPVFTIFGDIIMLIITIIGSVIGFTISGILIGRIVVWLLEKIGNRFKKESETNQND